MCLVLRLVLGWLQPSFGGWVEPISCLDEGVGSDPVFCLVERLRGMSWMPFLTPLVVGLTCQLWAPPVILYFSFAPRCLLPSAFDLISSRTTVGLLLSLLV